MGGIWYLVDITWEAILKIFCQASLVLDRWLKLTISVRWYGGTRMSNTGTNGTETNEIGMPLV
jgi:hypothetical protein